MKQKSNKNEIPESVRCEHMDGWLTSELDRSEYCLQRGITQNQLVYWLKLRREANKSKKPKRAFVAAKVLDSVVSVRPASTGARLLIGGSAVLELGAMADVDWAARLIIAVGSQL